MSISDSSSSRSSFSNSARFSSGGEASSPSVQVSPKRALPSRPSLENLRNQAKALQKQHKSGGAEALERVERVAPAAATPLKLHEAQFVVAREYGFASWPKLVEHVLPRSAERVRRENGRVWIEGVPRLRWGMSPEPTYIGALAAAVSGSERALDVMTLMGDSALCFRTRWATRDQGRAWCGSGPCGEWPEEVAALNASTGYVFEWDPQARGGASPEKVKRIVESIERGWPILGFGAQMDMGVFFGYEDGGRRVLLSDYWATEEPSVMPLEATKELGMFLKRIDPPSERAEAVQKGLSLAVQRWKQGVVDPDPTSGGTYHYGAAGFERWIADLERADTLTDMQRGNLFFLNGWTYSSLHMNRSDHAAQYLRANAEHLPDGALPHLEAAALCYDAMRERLGKWDAQSPAFGFVKQKKLDSWTPDVRAVEIALLKDVAALDARALAHVEQALRVASESH